jgi:pyruvate dehydrogenase E2 component (dihydrolipoamide acetyltransferase)
MPEVATDTQEATLVAWSVAENVPFALHDPIASVETAKAVVDLEAEADGVIFKTLVAQGADVQVGEPIAVIGTPDERIDDLDSLLIELGVGPSGAEDGLEQPPSENATTPPDQLVDKPGDVTAQRIFVSPLARRMAREAGLDVADIEGTGPAQRIIRRDIEAAIARRDNGKAAIASAGTVTDVRTEAAGDAGDAQPSSTFAPAPFRDVAHTRFRRTIAARLTSSTQTAPHFYLSAAPGVDRLLRLRRRLNGAAAVRVSLNDLLVKAVAAAHEMVPAMNVVWTAEATRWFSTVDVGIAVATESGLVTPVVRDVGARSLTSIASMTKDLVQRAHSGGLRQHELDGGSMTVTNLGMFGTRDFAAIINPPQAAILAVGAAVQEPVVSNGKVRVGTVMRLTLSVDHRPVDGATAAQWMQALVSLIQNPVRILA